MGLDLPSDGHFTHLKENRKFLELQDPIKLSLTRSTLKQAT